MVEYTVDPLSRAKFGHDRWAQYRSPRARIKKFVKFPFLAVFRPTAAQKYMEMKLGMEEHTVC